MKEDILKLIENVKDLYQKDENSLTFINEENKLFEVLEFINSNKISIVKLEKNELTLESLFMEVVK